jgi:hypothetical protein
MLFLAKKLNASRVNLLMNDFAAGLPSPLAFLGLGETIGRVLGAPHWGAGVLPILHKVDVSEGRTRAENDKKGEAFEPIEIAEDLVGSVEVSLLLAIPDCSEEHAVAEALAGRRIAGGPIHNADITVERVTLPDGSAFSKMHRGYALIPATPPEAAVIATGAIDDLKALAAKLYPAERVPGSGWFVPVAVGHRLLEDPDKVPKRANTRDPTIPHVFVEPCVGIAELVSVRNRRLTGLTEPQLRDLLWRWTAEGEWIVAHPNYHPDRRAAVAKEDIHGQR